MSGPTCPNWTLPSEVDNASSGAPRPLSLFVDAPIPGGDREFGMIDGRDEPSKRIMISLVVRTDKPTPSLETYMFHHSGKQKE
ncbi:hypothetical protein QJS10_CPB14g00674 [Acorus calamus]|uniref:Uncharacterized protein n=1 Tax=Acorus calamus TaxID=4465 RepID=A0AAV9D9Q0_ACOCL|nr:hypothetical protein QJS10_CPB14g00674 [Acorus calamus]